MHNNILLPPTEEKRHRFGPVSYNRVLYIESTSIQGSIFPTPFGVICTPSVPGSDPRITTNLQDIVRRFDNIDVMSLAGPGKSFILHQVNGVLDITYNQINIKSSAQILQQLVEALQIRLVLRDVNKITLPMLSISYQIQSLEGKNRLSWEVPMNIQNSQFCVTDKRRWQLFHEVTEDTAFLDPKLHKEANLEESQTSSSFNSNRQAIASLFNRIAKTQGIDCTWRIFLHGEIAEDHNTHSLTSPPPR